MSKLGEPIQFKVDKKCSSWLTRKLGVQGNRRGEEEKGEKDLTINYEKSLNPRSPLRGDWRIPEEGKEVGLGKRVLKWPVALPESLVLQQASSSSIS